MYDPYETYLHLFVINLLTLLIPSFPGMSVAACARDGVLHNHLHGPHHHGRRPPLHGQQLPQGARRQEQGGPREDQEEDQGAAQPQRQGEEGAQEGREAEEKVDEYYCQTKLLLLLYSVIQADGMISLSFVNCSFA